MPKYIGIGPTESQLPWSPEVWAQAAIGGLSKRALVGALRKKNVIISDAAQKVMNQKTFASLHKQEPKTVRFSSVRPLEIGSVSWSPTFGELYERIKTFGALCEPVDLLYLLLVQSKPEGFFKYLRVAMEPIVCSDGVRRTFDVQRIDDDDDVRVIDVVETNLEDECHTKTWNFIFRVTHTVTFRHEGREVSVSPRTRINA